MGETVCDGYANLYVAGDISYTASFGNVSGNNLKESIKELDPKNCLAEVKYGTAESFSGVGKTKKRIGFLPKYQKNMV